MKEGKRRGADRTQIATRDEEWSDERLKTFLDAEPPIGMPTDYNVLLRAYRGMTAELFERFIVIYKGGGRDINVTLSDGSNFLDLGSQHRKSADYAAALEAAGAIKNSN